jgi:hypothetical protein
MNEETELWAAYKEQQKQERAKRRASAEQHLKERGINYTVHNDGAHIVIEEGGAIFDYWPGNARWRMRPYRSDFGEQQLFAAISQRRLVSQDFSKLEQRVLAQMVDAGKLTSEPFKGDPYALKLRAPETDEAFVERMTRAFPHLKGE